MGLLGFREFRVSGFQGFRGFGMQGSGLRVLVEGFGVRLRVCGSKVLGMIFFLEEA